MYKKIKRLCSVLCSGVCLSGGSSANTAGTGFDKRLFSKKMHQFVNRRIKSHKYSNERIVYKNKGLRLLGELGVLTCDKVFDKKFKEALKSLDLSPLKKYIADTKTRARYCCAAPVLFGLLTAIVFFCIGSNRVKLSKREIRLLNKIRFYDEVKLIAEHFGLNIAYEENEVEIVDPVNEVKLEENTTIDPQDEDKRREFASKMFKVLLKAQIENLFGMLPKDVKEAFDKFQEREEFKAPDGWTISKALRYYWEIFFATPGFSGAVLILCSLSGNILFQTEVGASEEVSVVVKKMEELLKADTNTKTSKSDDLKASNVRKSIDSVSFSKTSISKSNVSHKKDNLGKKKMGTRKKSKFFKGFIVN